MAELKDLNVTDASNIARFPNGQNPSTVNDGARALEGMLARHYRDNNCTVTAGGTGDAIAVAMNQTISALYDGLIVSFEATAANTGATTVNPDSLGATALKKHGAADLAANDLKIGQKVLAVYDGTNFQMLSQLGNAAVLAANNGSEFTEAIFKQNLNLEIGVDVQAYDADTAKTDAKQSFTAQQRPHTAALTYNATQTWDCDAAQDATLTLTGNITSFSAPTNQVAGAHYVLRINVGSGPYSVTAWNAAFRWAGGTPPSLTATANAVDVMTFRSDGTNMELIGLAQDVK